MGGGAPVMGTNVERFTLDVNEFVDTTAPEAVALATRKLTLQGLTKVVFRTPVLTGRARGNWQVTLDAPASGEIGIIDSNGAATVERGLGVIATIGAFARAFITNNVPYILVLEHGGYPLEVRRGTRVRGSRPARYAVRSQAGFSKQAPQGMVELTVLELRDQRMEAG